MYINVSSITCTFLYSQKVLKKCETFIYIYKKPDTLKTERQFALRSEIPKARRYTFPNFHDFFKLLFI